MNAQKSTGRIPMNKKKIIVIVCLGAILLLNVLWTVLQNRFTPKLEEVQADLAKMDARLARLEQGGFSDIADLREEFGALKEISAEYKVRLGQFLKAEEDQLANLEAQASAQRNRVESLRGQLAPMGISTETQAQ